jgi:hypothetical protein
MQSLPRATWPLAQGVNTGFLKGPLTMNIHGAETMIVPAKEKGGSFDPPLAVTAALFLLLSG